MSLIKTGERCRGCLAYDMRKYVCNLGGFSKIRFCLTVKFYRLVFWIKERLRAARRRVKT